MRASKGSQKGREIDHLSGQRARAEHRSGRRLLQIRRSLKSGNTGDLSVTTTVRPSTFLRYPAAERRGCKHRGTYMLMSRGEEQSLEFAQTERDSSFFYLLVSEDIA